MYALIGWAFSLLSGVMLVYQGISALLWTPLGGVIALYATAQIVLPLLLGIPRAIKFVRKGEMRPAVFGRIILAPISWLVILFIVSFGIGFCWPSAADYLYNNLAFNMGLNLGMLAIILSPISRQARSDFNADFDKAYGGFYQSPE